MTPPKPHRSESEIKRSVMELLRARGLLCFRMNSFDRVIVENDKRRRIAGHPAGTADIVFFLPTNYETNSGKPLPLSVVVWVELKSDTGVQSPKQRQFQAMVEREGQIYLIARSAFEVEQFLAQNL